jgi:hypothetical protein
LSRLGGFFVSAESAGVAVWAVPVFSARTVSCAAVAFFSAVRLSAVTGSVFLSAAFLCDSETALSVY